jgi:hypothetical protein
MSYSVKSTTYIGSSSSSSSTFSTLLVTGEALIGGDVTCASAITTEGQMNVNGSLVVSDADSTFERGLTVNATDDCETYLNGTVNLTADLLSTGSQITLANSNTAGEYNVTVGSDGTTFNVMGSLSLLGSSEFFGRNWKISVGTTSDPASGDDVNSLIFTDETEGLERMRIDPNGALLLGATANADVRGALFSSGIAEFTDQALFTGGASFPAALSTVGLYSESMISAGTSGAPYTLAYSAGGIYFIPSTTTLSSNFSVTISGIPTTMSTSYTLTLCFAQTTTKYYCSSCKIIDTDGTYLCSSSSSTYVTPLFSGGTPSLSTAPNFVLQSFSVIRFASSSYLCSSVSACS